MGSRAATLLFVCCCAASGAAAQTAQLQPAASEIVFTTRQMGVPVEGRFAQFSAELALDPKSPQTGRVSLAIDTGSARFASAELETEVIKDSWLAAARFPQARFESTAIKPGGPGRFQVSGKLTIKGRTQDVEVPVELQPAARGLTSASGAFTIKRQDFGVGSGEWADASLLLNEVQVRFKLVFSGLGVP